MTPLRLTFILVLAFAVFIGICIATTPRYTLITKDRRADGAILAEPIYPVTLTLEPMNSVAKAIGVGEALRCAASIAADTVSLDCDGARFMMSGFRLQE